MGNATLSVRRMHLGTLFLLTIFTFWLAKMTSMEGKEEFDWMYFYLAGFGVWFATVRIIYKTLYGENKIQNNGIIIGESATVVGLLFSCLILFMLSVAKNAPALSFLVEIALKTYILCFVIYVIIFALDIRCQVKDGTIVFLDNRILFPGEKYLLFPLANHQTRIINEKVHLSLGKIMVQCQDAQLEMMVETSVLLEIDKAKHYQIHGFDYRGFIETTKAIINTSLISQAKSLTVGQLLTEKLVPVNETAAGLPFVWNGEMEGSLVHVG